MRSAPRAVDGLADTMPQDEASSIRIAGEIDGSIYIACRDGSQDGENPLGQLTSVEYEVLAGGAQGWRYTTIAHDIDRAISTVRTHLHNIFTKLDVVDMEGAASFIPIKKTVLEAHALHEADGTPKTPKLSDTEEQVLEQIAGGLVSKQIAQQRKRAVSTARTHRMSLANKLGITPDVERRGVMLRRIAGGLQNLNIYAQLSLSIESQLDPEITAILAKCDQLVDGQTIKELGANVIYTAENKSLLNRLGQGGYISHDAAMSGHLDLQGLVAASLIRRARDGGIPRATDHIVNSIVRKRTNAHLDHQRAAGTEPRRSVHVS